MQSRIKPSGFGILMVGFATIFLIAQEPDHPKLTITGVPGEPIAAGDCTDSTFGYLTVDGKRQDFTEADFGKTILPALRQGYVITLYPPTKRGIFINEECHSSRK
jgi:hypothetical protein